MPPEQPAKAAAGSAAVKYFLLEHGHSENENTLHAFDTPAERDATTILKIFGTDLSCQDEAEQWDKMREELNDKGSLTFEGDPGLEWFVAHEETELPALRAAAEKVLAAHAAKNGHALGVALSDLRAIFQGETTK